VQIKYKFIDDSKELLVLDEVLPLLFDENGGTTTSRSNSSVNKTIKN
jgi:hypothetical protein